jgi:hypothetical protein
MMTHAKMTTVPADMREPSPREVVSHLRERHVPYQGAGPRARLGKWGAPIMLCLFVSLIRLTRADCQGT